jgi:predicted transcriptional regulator
LGVGASKLAELLNSDYRNVSRALHKLVDTGIVERIPINGNTNKFALAENNGIVTGPLPDWF